jgi:hypothetical protein
MRYIKSLKIPRLYFSAPILIIELGDGEFRSHPAVSKFRLPSYRFTVSAAEPGVACTQGRTQGKNQPVSTF